MSAAAEGSGSTTKAITSDPTNSSTMKDQLKPAAALEEDDEFEDFPIDGEYQYLCSQRMLLTCSSQIGRRKRAKSRLGARAAQRIYGKRVGMMMIRVRIFQSN